MNEIYKDLKKVCVDNEIDHCEIWMEIKKLKKEIEKLKKENNQLKGDDSK